MAKLVVALDVDKQKAISLINKLSSKVKYYKIGHKLFTGSPEIINFLNRHNKKVILDLKYHDIPSVVGFAIEEISRKYKPFALTLHISGGRSMLEESVNAKDKLPNSIRPILFGVTVLTSLNTEDFSILYGMRGMNIDGQVKKMALFAKKYGLDGIVCSGNELKTVKKNCGRKFLTLVPGVSIEENMKRKDQKRTIHIGEAVRYGADYVVIGRHITQSENPVKVVEKIWTIKKY